MKCVECKREISVLALADICRSCYWRMDAAFDKEYGECQISSCKERAIPRAAFARYMEEDLCAQHQRIFYMMTILRIRRWYGK